MVGRLLSVGNSPFLKDMLIFRERVVKKKQLYIYKSSRKQKHLCLLTIHWIPKKVEDKQIQTENHQLRIQNHQLRIQNHQLRIQNDQLRIQEARNHHPLHWKMVEETCDVESHRVKLGRSQHGWRWSGWFHHFGRTFRLASTIFSVHV